MPRHDLKHPAGIEDLLLFRMSKVIAQGGSIVTRICEGRFGITRREWTVLAITARADSMLWAEVSRRCEIDDARLSRAVSSLVDKKLLLKSQLPHRQLALSLTQAGRDLYAQMFPIALGINAQMMSALDPGLADALVQALERLHERGEQMVRDTVVPKANRSRGARRGG